MNEHQPPTPMYLPALLLFLPGDKSTSTRVPLLAAHPSLSQLPPTPLPPFFPFPSTPPPQATLFLHVSAELPHWGWAAGKSSRISTLQPNTDAARGVAGVFGFGARTSKQASERAQSLPSAAAVAAAGVRGRPALRLRLPYACLTLALPCLACLTCLACLVSYLLELCTLPCVGGGWPGLSASTLRRHTHTHARTLVLCHLPSFSFFFLVPFCSLLTTPTFLFRLGGHFRICPSLLS